MKRRFLIDDPRTAKFVADSVGSTDCQCRGSVGLEIGGKIVAGATFDNVSGPNCFIHFSNDKSLPVFSRDLLKLVFGYAFNVLKVKRITGAFAASHKRVVRLGEICGFKFETKLAGAAYDGSDMWFYRLYRKDCRFIV